MECIKQHHWPPQTRPKSAKNHLFGQEMVELRSPDLWKMQKNAKFHGRFAHEGPEAVRAQFGGVNGSKTQI